MYSGSYPSELFVEVGWFLVFFVVFCSHFGSSFGLTLLRGEEGGGRGQVIGSPSMPSPGAGLRRMGPHVVGRH